MRRSTSARPAEEDLVFTESTTLAGALPEAPRRKSFVRELVIHSCFSLILICVIVAGLRLEKKRTTTKQEQPVKLVETDEFALLQIDELEAIVTRRRQQAASLRRSGVVMERDPDARRVTEALQNATRRLLTRRYGPGPTYKLKMSLRFPESLDGGDAALALETASIDWMPHAVHVFLDSCVTRREPWKAAFHRNAGHVLQAFVRSPNAFGLAFQEYDARFPHKKYTLGFAGRPGGPEFYISTVDNTRNHGPGSQGSKTEADACFAKIVDGFDVVERMKRQAGGAPEGGGLGFVRNSEDYIQILTVDIM